MDRKESGLKERGDDTVTQGRRWGLEPASRQGILLSELNHHRADAVPSLFPSQFVFCQVCCEPFHLFCLGEKERPLKEQWENWCCRRCRFCQVCGRQPHKSKVSKVIEAGWFLSDNHCLSYLRGRETEAHGHQKLQKASYSRCFLHV